MNELANLQIRVDSLDVKLARGELGKLSRSGASAERATDRLAGAFRRIAGPAAVFAGAMLSLNKLTNVTRQFDVLNAQLLTATGSTEGAAKAFEAIQDFATKTPFDLQQVTKGFVQLVNLGLTPSERALTSYGDTASAMGKDLNQLIEAVADAATGEFERLKEFGIKAKSEGDNVSFTFRGVTTTVRKNAAEIEGYLINLGETDFAGAMQNRVNSLDGALSNLADEWDKLFLNISQKGIGDRIEATVRIGIEALEELNAQLASGELDGYITAIGSKFDGIGEDIAYTLDILTDLFARASKSWSDDGEAAAFDIGEALTDLPENVRAVVGIMAVEFAAFADYGSVYGGQFIDAVELKFDELVATARVYATAVREAFTPFSAKEYDLVGELDKVDARFNGLADKAASEMEARLAGIREARADTVDGILAERSAALQSYDDQIAASSELRAEYDRQKAARDAAGGDRLEQFKTGGSDSGPSAAETKRAEKEAKDRERAMDSLREHLRTEEESIDESYRRRKEIILANTQEGSDEQIRLLERLDAMRVEQAQRGFDELHAVALSALGREREVEEMRYTAQQERFQNELARLEEQGLATEEVREKFRQAQTDAEIDHQARITEIQEAEAEKRRRILMAQADAVGSFFGMIGQFAKEGSKVQRIALAAEKAAALAKALINMQVAISQASVLPFPANIPAIAQAASQGAQIVATIKSVDVGAVAHGGLNLDDINMRSDEMTVLAQSGERILSRDQNRDLTDFMKRDKATAMQRPEPQPAKKEAATATPQAPQAAPNVGVFIDAESMVNFMATSRGREMTINNVLLEIDTIEAALQSRR